jgi:hypothetical protein
VDPQFEDLDWAKALVDEGAFVMHVETRTVGKVVELYDGEGKLYVSPTNDKPVRAPVLKLDRGHAFVARRGAFIVLEAKEAVFFLDAQRRLAGCLAAIAARGGELGVMAQAGGLVVAAVLRSQLLEVERLFPGAGRGDAASG